MDGVPAAAVACVGAFDAPGGFLVIGGDGDGHYFVLLPGGDVEAAAHGERGVDAHELLAHFQAVCMFLAVNLGGGFAPGAAEVGAQLQDELFAFAAQGEPVVGFAFGVAHAAGAPRFAAMLQVDGEFLCHGVGGQFGGQQHGECHRGCFRFVGGGVAAGCEGERQRGGSRYFL